MMYLGFMAEVIVRHPDTKIIFQEILLKVWYRGKDNQLTDEQCFDEIDEYIRACIEE